MRNFPEILIVEDDAAIGRLMALHLKAAGHSVELCADGTRAVELLSQRPWKLVVLDRMLPGKSGMQILRWLNSRTREERTPVLMVTALGATAERVQGLNEGADDYLPKPFEPDELVARVAALLRRTASAETVLELSGLRLDLGNSEAFIASGERIVLSPLEFRMLLALVKKPGRVRSREYLLDHVWGQNSFVEPRTVDATIKRLRKQLDAAGLSSCVETVRGLGYRFVAGEEQS